VRSVTAGDSGGERRQRRRRKRPATKRRPVRPPVFGLTSEEEDEEEREEKRDEMEEVQVCFSSSQEGPDRKKEGESLQEVSKQLLVRNDVFLFPVKTRSWVIFNLKIMWRI